MPTEMRVLAIRDAPRGTVASPIRRSLFASVLNMRRSSNDYRTSHAGHSPSQCLDCGQTQRKVSRDVANRHGAHESAGRSTNNCSVVQRSLTPSDPAGQIGGTLRSRCRGPMKAIVCCLHTSTLNSPRRCESLSSAFSQSVDEFLEVYPCYIEQVRPELNGLFREEDYPSAENLRAKFGVKLEVLPIPSGDDFRVTLSEEEQARVAREIDESVRQSLNRGTKDLWARLTDVVTHMVDKLNEPDSRFHASFVTNVFDLVDLLPRLNVSRDEELNRFAAEIKDRLCNFSAHDLKKNEILRVSTATDAAQILSQMDAVLRGREQDVADTNDKSTPQSAPSVEAIFSHMSAYMEAATP